MTPIYQIHVLHFGDFDEVDYTLVAHLYKPGTNTTVPIYGYLITGENIAPILVDTGINEDFLDAANSHGVKIIAGPDNTLRAQLEKHGYSLDDIGYIIHTHVHFDHAGNDHLLPNAKIIVPRGEMMCAASGLMGGSYSPDDVAYLIHQIYVPGRVKFFDEDIQLAPGIDLVLTQGHTSDSAFVKVNTKGGIASIVGDIVYNIELSTGCGDDFFARRKEERYALEDFNPKPTGTIWSLRGSLAAIQKVMRESDIVLPAHDPVVVKRYGYVL